MLRQKIYTDRNELDDFLSLSPAATLNKDIYEVLLSLRKPSIEGHRLKRLKSPTLCIFNEAYYQCTKLFLDKHPEEDFLSNYYDDAHAHLGCTDSTDVVFSIVFVLLSVMANKTVKSEFFLQIILEQLSSSPYFPPFSSIANHYRDNDVSFPLSFPPCPIDISDPRSLDWAKITHNFNSKIIDEAIQLSSNEESQHAILDAICAQYRRSHLNLENNSLDNAFASLRAAIVSRFSSALPSDKEHCFQTINHTLISQRTALERDYASVCQQYRYVLDENLSLKKNKCTISELLAIAREHRSNDLFEVLRLFASNISDLPERIKIEQEIAANRDSNAQTFSSSVFLNNAPGFKTNFERLINCICELGFFRNKFGQNASKMDVFDAMGIATHSDLKRYSKTLSNSRAAAKADCQNELAIFHALTDKQKEICGLIS